MYEFKCNHQGLCCQILKNDIWSIYPSDVLQLLEYYKTSFEIFTLDKIDIRINSHGHFSASMSNKDEAIIRDGKFYRCPFASKTNQLRMSCNIYDFRPLRCRLYPLFPPKPEKEEDQILQWVTPLEQWEWFTGICNGCLYQFKDQSKKSTKIDTYTLKQWLQKNEINQEEVNREFALLRELYSKLEESALSPASIKRVAVSVLHTDLVTALESNLGHTPELMPAVLDILKEDRPQTIDELIERGYKKLDFEITKIIEEQKIQATYM